MRLGLAATGLLGLSCSALAQGPSSPPPTQVEEGRCVAEGVQDRFREPGPAEALARDIVARCIPEKRRTTNPAGPNKAYFDQRNAHERASAVEVSVLRIEHFRSSAAAAASIPKGEPTMTAPAAERILRMATQGWREPVRVKETRLQGRAVERAAPGSDWKKSASRKVEVRSGGGRFATYYVDSAGRVTGLFVSSGPPGLCRPFGAGESLAVGAALAAVPTATAEEVRQVRASVRSGWTPGSVPVPAKVGPYFFLASRIGPGGAGCHDRLGLSLAAGG